jgi:hypothetical protein
MASRAMTIIETWLVPPWEKFCYEIQTMKRHRYPHRRQRQTTTATGKCQGNQATRTTTRQSQDHVQRNKRSQIQILYQHSEDESDEDTDLRPRSVRFDTDSKLIRIDNCASKCISPHLEDFIGETRETSKRVKGIGGTIVQGIRVGTIKWQIEDDEGVVHDLLLTNSYYVPSSPSRLLSPQHWAQLAKDNKPKPRGTWCATYDYEIIVYWNQRKNKRTVKIDPNQTNVAEFQTAPGYNKFLAFCHEIGEADEQSELLSYDSNVISDDEAEIDSDNESDEDVLQDEIDPNDRQDPLTTDFNLNGPSGLQDVPMVIPNEEDTIPETDQAEFLQWHHRLGHISPKKIRKLAQLGILPNKLSKCKVPLCTSCLFGKATRRPWRTKAKPKSVLKTITRPGQCVSVDQLESTTPGMIAQLKGIPTTKRYTAATVFVDHFSGLGYVHLQKTTNADETVQAKQAFEAYADSHGVKVLHYHADNGRFAENKWRNACAAKGQTLSFCGVNAHHQNGVAERRIRELQEHARTMLIHATKRWPNAIDAHLWPYAIRMANDVINETPDLKRGDVPIKRFAQTDIEMNPTHWYHFGSPVYVLNAKLQAGKKIDKWSDRARVGIYLGRSPQHARNIAVVLSLTTGLASPQFHVKVDTTFQTIRKAFGGMFPKSQWQEKCHFKKVSQEPAQEETKTDETSTEIIPPEGATLPRIAFENSDPPDEPEEQHQVQDSQEQGESQDTQDNRRRSPRHRKKTQRLIEEAMMSELEHPSGTQTYHVAFEAFSIPWSDLDADDCTANPLIAFASSHSDKDTMWYHEAMREPDRKEFLQAAANEVADQTKNGNWVIVHRSTVPTGATILPAVWAMKRKRRIKTREVYKWKARLNLDGSKQTKGKNFWETYSPVAAWSTIRFILTMAILNKWYTRQIDYVLAFPQAPVEIDDLYMKVPKGFEIQGAEKDEYLLHIRKNVYGGCSAGRVWNKYLIEKLTSIGFVPSDIDDSVFYKGNAVYVLYTDDSILAGPDNKELDKIIAQMRSTGLELTEEGDIEDFLGVNIERKDDGSVHLTQPQLISQILEDLRLDGDNTTVKQTPCASSLLLKRHSKSASFDGHFDYRSIIGKLNYLEKSSRPDISYITHMLARFQADPKKEHGQAVMWLGRYLAGTRTKGLIFKPDKNESFEVYCDSDWSGNWDREEAVHDVDTARSRSGYVISYAGCPIVWASKLQTLIALSSTEAEYISCSTALRETIPLMRLTREFRDKGYNIRTTIPTVHCRLFEDNTGALEIATIHKVRPRTKHLNVQLHHFRSYVDQGDIKILPISSELQRSDLLTHPTSLSTLQRHRMAIMGW